jgi:hypothetical protein
MSRGRSSDPDQAPIPGMPLPLEAVNLTARYALGHILRPEFVGLDPEQYLDITPAVTAEVNANRLYSSLIGVRYRSRGSIGCQLNTGGIQNITVTPEEYQYLFAYPGNLGRVVVSRTAKSSGYSESGYQVDPGKPERAGKHAVGRRLELLEKLAGSQVTEKELIGRFAVAAAHPGWAVLGPGVDVRLQLTQLRSQVFGNLLSAAGFHRGWSVEEIKQAGRALDKLLYIDRANNKHIGSFRALLRLANQWNTLRHELTKTRITQAEEYLNGGG